MAGNYRSRGSNISSKVKGLVGAKRSVRLKSEYIKKGKEAAIEVNKQKIRERGRQDRLTQKQKAKLKVQVSDAIRNKRSTLTPPKPKKTTKKTTKSPVKKTVSTPKKATNKTPVKKTISIRKKTISNKGTSAKTVKRRIAPRRKI